MPGRNVILANNLIYHIINRGVASVPIFLSKRDYSRALDTIFYYQYLNLPLKYSHFIVQSGENKIKIINKLKSEKNLLVEIFAYCLMPNHFHMLLKQKKDNGISKFMSNFSNSYTRYFNTKHSRKGSLFQGKFEAARIETEEQLLHVSRYIHLNPYTSFVVKDFEKLEKYPYSSFGEYISDVPRNLGDTEIILSNFRNKAAYKEFVLDRADYQRQLEHLKHLVLEK